MPGLWKLRARSSVLIITLTCVFDWLLFFASPLTTQEVNSKWVKMQHHVMCSHTIRHERDWYTVYSLTFPINCLIIKKSECLVGTERRQNVSDLEVFLALKPLFWISTPERPNYPLDCPCFIFNGWSIRSHEETHCSPIKFENAFRKTNKSAFPENLFTGRNRVAILAFRTGRGKGNCPWFVIPGYWLLDWIAYVE